MAPMGRVRDCKVTLSRLFCSTVVPPHPQQSRSVWPYNSLRSDSDITPTNPRISIRRGFIEVSVSFYGKRVQIRYTTATTAAQPSCHPRHIHASDSRNSQLPLSIPLYYLDTYITSRVTRLSHALSRLPRLTRRAHSRPERNSSRNGAGQAIVRLGD